MKKSSDKTVIINRQEYLPDLLQKEEYNAEQSWQDIQKEKTPREFKNKKRDQLQLL